MSATTQSLTPAFQPSSLSSNARDIINAYSQCRINAGSDLSPEAEADSDAAVFVLKLATTGSDRGVHLVGSPVPCEPPVEHRRKEFHWLLLAMPSSSTVHTFSAACDLWRWVGFEWRSVTVPGAVFAPEELYAQGWRYCGPCIQKVVRVDVLPAPSGVERARWEASCGALK